MFKKSIRAEILDNIEGVVQRAEASLKAAHEILDKQLIEELDSVRNGHRVKREAIRSATVHHALSEIAASVPDTRPA